MPVTTLHVFAPDVVARIRDVAPNVVAARSADEAVVPDEFALQGRVELERRVERRGRADDRIPPCEVLGDPRYARAELSRCVRLENVPVDARRAGARVAGDIYTGREVDAGYVLVERRRYDIAVGEAAVDISPTERKAVVRPDEC